jgi:hypothetical protein
VFALRAGHREHLALVVFAFMTGFPLDLEYCSGVRCDFGCVDISTLQYHREPGAESQTAPTG